MPEYVIAKYIRLSIDDVQSESMSIENQRLILDKHLEELDIPNAEIIEFADNGYTGLNFERPAVQELLDLVREGRVNCIVVKDFSRFGRSAIETGYFIERVFPLFGVRFISVSDCFDSAEHDGHIGGMEVALKFMIHEQYSRDLSKKIKSAKHEKMRRGEYVRKNCVFGYELNEKRQMVIDEPAAETVKLIFNLALERKSLSQTAKRLYEEKRPTPGEYNKKAANPSCIWHSAVIGYILADEQYAGTYIAGRKKKSLIWSKAQTPQPENEWYKIPDHHPAIIEKDLFVAVQEIINKKAEPLRKRKIGTSQRYGKIENPLKGKVICGCCGHVMQLSCTKNAAFKCKFTLAAVDAECHRLDISSQELSKTLFKIISKQARVILKSDNFNDVSELSLKTEQQSEYAKQINEINDKKCRLYEQYVLKEINAKDYRVLKANLDREHLHLMQIHSAVSAETAKLTAMKSKGGEYRKIAEKVSGKKTLTRPLADSLIDRVLIYPDNKIEVHWKFADLFSGVAIK